MNDRKTVALTLIVTFLLLVLDETLNRDRAPKPRRVLGFAIVFLVLGFLVEVQSAAKVAKYFSVLFLLGTAYKIGPELFPKSKIALAGNTPKKKG